MEKGYNGINQINIKNCYMNYLGLTILAVMN